MAQKTITIEGPVNPGTLIPRPPSPGQRGKASRFYNFPEDWVPPKRDKKTGAVVEKAERPRGVQFTREVPDDHWHRELIRCGDVRLVEAKPTKPIKPVAKTVAGGDA